MSKSQYFNTNHMGASMTGDIYLHMSGVTGLAAPASRREWMRCDGITWNWLATTGASPAGKTSAGRRANGSIVLARGSDWASPALLRLCEAGSKVSSAKIELTRARAGGEPAPYVEIELFDIVPAKLALEPDYQAGRPRDASIEKLLLAYAMVKWRYCPTQRLQTAGS
jgi:type VI protein secretion system component Hcp